MEPTHAASVPTPAPRADLLAELGLGAPTAGPSEPAGHPGGHARPAAAPVAPLDVLADIAGVSLTSLEFVRTDDKRASLTRLCTTLGWSNGTELVAFTDVATRRDLPVSDLGALTATRSRRLAVAVQAPPRGWVRRSCPMNTRYAVWTDRGTLSSWHASEADARSRDGAGRLTQSGRTYDLPDGWRVQRVELGELDDPQVLAIAWVASQSDGGCAYCVATAHRDLLTLWPDVDWAQAIRSVSRVYEDMREFESEHPLVEGHDPDRWLDDPPPRWHGA